MWLATPSSHETLIHHTSPAWPAHTSPFPVLFNPTHQLVERDYAYILWSAETPDNTYALATDTFTIRNGQIVAQSFTAKITPKPRA